MEVLRGYRELLIRVLLTTVQDYQKLVRATWRMRKSQANGGITEGEYEEALRAIYRWLALCDGSEYHEIRRLAPYRGIVEDLAENVLADARKKLQSDWMEGYLEWIDIYPGVAKKLPEILEQGIEIQ